MTWLVVAVLVLGTLWWLRSGSISSERAHALVAQGATLVDVRSPQEFAQGHIEGALNIPVGELPARISELGAREKTFVLYCRSGARSKRAQALLVQSGFPNVHNLGAMARW